MLLRAILAALFVLVAGAHVVRTAAVTAYAENEPATAAAFWADHPDSVRSVAMGQVGDAAGRGQTPPAEALEGLRELANAEPLAVEPFLVDSAIAQRTGDFERAERLLVQARKLAPRSAAARFLLADLYFRTGRILPGLAEMSVLGKLVPGAMQQVAPSLAAYATSAGAAPHLRRILIDYPQLEQPLLSRLAEDPGNTDLILSISQPGRSAGQPPAWQEKLLGNLVKEGSYARAHAVWARLAGVPQEGSRGLFDPGFRQSGAPAPFNWKLESSGRGVAEPADGGLSVLYYGRQDAVLARQVMLLPAGRYRLEMALSGQISGESNIGWTVACLPGGRQLLQLPLGGRAGSRVGGEFSVPGEGCVAQRIELVGAGTEFPEAADFRITDLQLTRVAG